MGKLTKNQKLALEKIEAGKAYTLKEAAKLVKEITTTKFDASVDIDVRLGVDPRKANQMVRGVVSLPNGTGKQVRVLALCTPDKEADAKAAGADYVGLDEYIEKIKGGWTDVDVIITMPAIMGKIGALGRILGPRGLMPNPKSGTVTLDVATLSKANIIAIDGLELNLDNKSVIVDNENVPFTKKEFELLQVLMENPNKVLSRDDLLKMVWSDDVCVVARTVDVNITRIRKKIGKYGSRIVARQGFGYSFSK